MVERAFVLLTCLLAACDPSAEPVDAGGGDAPRVDGGRADADPSDVGTADGGLHDDVGALLDAPMPDAAELDAPVLDAGELDAPTFDAPTFDAPTFDAPTFDAPTFDAPRTTPTLGSAAIARRIYATGPPTGTLATSAVTTQTGSLLLVSIARGTWSAAPSPPTDSRGSTFALVGTTHAYADWPTSQTGLYSATSGARGAGHTFSMTWGDVGGTGDEVSLSAVEVLGGGSIEDASWVERSAASTITSASVTTTGPALLVAWWWGSGGVRPVGTSHIATPGSGFTLVPGATGLTSLSTNGYIQVAVAYRTVTASGSYTVSWSGGEGAQLYLVAVRGS